MTKVKFFVLLHTSFTVLLVRLVYPITPMSDENILISSNLFPKSLFKSGLFKHFWILSFMRLRLKKTEASVLFPLRCFSIAWTETIYDGFILINEGHD